MWFGYHTALGAFTSCFSADQQWLVEPGSLEMPLKTRWKQPLNVYSGSCVPSVLVPLHLIPFILGHSRLYWSPLSFTHPFFLPIFTLLYLLPLPSCTHLYHCLLLFAHVICPLVSSILYLFHLSFISHCLSIFSLFYLCSLFFTQLFFFGVFSCLDLKSPCLPLSVCWPSKPCAL